MSRVRAAEHVVETIIRPRIILDRQAPMPSARRIVEANYTADSQRTLHHWRGGFYQWTGTHYASADTNTDAVKAAVWKFLENAQHRTAQKDLVPYNPNLSRVSNVLGAMAAVCHLPASAEAPSWIRTGSNEPAADEFLAVANGLLHLPSGELRSATPGYFGTNCAGVAYDRDAPEPEEWLRFLDQVWPKDQQSILTLQEMFGYFLSPDTSQQKIGLIVGPKRSGKGTIQRTLAALLGPASVAAPTLAGLGESFGVAPLIGKSLAIVADARLSARADQAAIAERLLSISGEDIQTVHRKFLDAWTGRLSVRFLIMTNELPRLADASGALASRFILLMMEQSFYGREDLGLGARVLLELPGILKWALEGYRRLRDRGYFIQPDSAREAIADLEALGSPIKAFIGECCIIKPGLQCAPVVLFDAWKTWCTRQGRKEPGTLQNFGRDLRAAVPGVKMAQPRTDGGRARVYEGIGLQEYSGNV